MAERKIWYEPHPVSADRKAELRAQGYTIVDAKFDPEAMTEKAKPDAEIEAAHQPLTRTHVARMAKRHLQEACRANGLDDTGTVDAMRERLAEHLF